MGKNTKTMLTNAFGFDMLILLGGLCGAGISCTAFALHFRQDLTARRYNHYPAGDLFAAVFQSGFHHKGQASTAGNLHPGDRDRADIVIPENLRQLFRIARRGVMLPELDVSVGLVRVFFSEAEGLHAFVHGNEGAGGEVDAEANYVCGVNTGAFYYLAYGGGEHLKIVCWDMPMYYYNYLRPGSISWEIKQGGKK